MSNCAMIATGFRCGWPDGQMHDYVPDFIIRLNTTPESASDPGDERFDPLVEVKKHAAERWVNAVTGTYGKGLYVIGREPEEVSKAISRGVTVLDDHASLWTLRSVVPPQSEPMTPSTDDVKNVGCALRLLVL